MSPRVGDSWRPASDLRSSGGRRGERGAGWPGDRGASGDIILLVSWRDQSAAEAFEGSVSLQDGARLRRVRVVRDYGMFDRREAPQYYPDAKGAETKHA